MQRSLPAHADDASPHQYLHMPIRSTAARFEQEGLEFVVLRRVSIVVLVLFLVPGIFAAYRAWVQVRSLEIRASSPTLGAGSTVTVDGVSWARTYVAMRLVLKQGARTDTLMRYQIGTNAVPSLDPRMREASVTVTLGADLLANYHDGEARLIATAIGRPQWMRIPPPLVRETAVRLRTPGAAR
jgi:hypothetical protein